MSEQTSTASKDSDESLLKHENVKSLTSLVASKCESGEEVEWKELMEWFVCAVIGLNSKGLESNGSFWFDWDDVVVDGFGTARINLSASNSKSYPFYSPQSFSIGFVRMSRLFLNCIHRLSKANCLPKQINLYSRQHLMLQIFRDLIDRLVRTGHIVPACDPSKFEEIVSEHTSKFMKLNPTALNMVDNLRWMVQGAYSIVHLLETVGLVNHPVRVTDSEADPRSPHYQQFTKIVDPEVDKLITQFHQEVFQEARRIASWKEFLQKVSDGEEVEDDTSFLKLSFFRPTLLSLQAKFQTLASPKDGPDDNSTLSLHSSRSSPLTSLDAHLDPSLRTHSSSPNFRQESLRLLTILHSLLTSPLPPSLLTTPPPPSLIRYSINPHSLIQISDRRLGCLQQATVDRNEKFRSSLFDEIDNETLARSLVRCQRVCEFVGAEKCIDDLFNFIDRNVSALNTSNTLIRTAAFFLFQDLVETSCVLPLLPRLWDRFRTAFRDGQLEEQYSAEFDWDGLINADLSDDVVFVNSIFVMEALRHGSHEDQVLLLCHTSLNPLKPGQPPLDILFERTLRVNPLEFFNYVRKTDMDLPPTLLNTSLCGFHALCRRGVHFSLMETDTVRDGHHLANSFWMFSTPLISDTFELFLSFPPTLVVRFILPILTLKTDDSVLVDPLKELMSKLLLTTAPFGDLHSVRELYRSVGQSSCHCEDPSTESFITSDCESIEWLNIPTGFSSALALQINQPVAIDKCYKPSRLTKDISKFMSGYVTNIPH
ncbi:hypothetical protein BLNAU_21139 [Blattamonas nauphoetae]|uniref:Ubiquitin conjugation factor E4 core domain-containing protein n=1 Tax=Blattamonas nauphoetae TaxID=2049346 RepID=A0ABQ9WWQ5_9EUKA|nr:hypothetical protein BLNAU_21139 [Blattamonas nauphoetae]